jgi:transcriptional regulator with XRE-family HTH domain
MSMLELHEEIRRARKEVGLSQDQLAQLCGIQRRQLSILERGGNVTLATLKKVLGFLPNLREFTFEQVRMTPTYRDFPPFEWSLFYRHMADLSVTLEDVSGAVKEWLANPPSPEVDPELLTRRATNLATEMLKTFSEMSKVETEHRRAEARRKKEEQRELEQEAAEMGDVGEEDEEV